MSFFNDINVELNDNLVTRDELYLLFKRLDASLRLIVFKLQNIHKAKVIKDKFRALSTEILDDLHAMSGDFKTIMSTLGSESYYKHWDIWRPATQRLVACYIVVYFLKDHTLATRELIASKMGFGLSSSDNLEGVRPFFVDIEDYLFGVLGATQDLSRLAINAIVADDFDLPLHISTFMGDLDAGFRCLNLKNGALRRKYDSLKWDLKKVEEVVYDIRLRKFEQQKGDCPAQIGV